jgi:hypothetical protein
MQDCAEVSSVGDFSDVRSTPESRHSIAIGGCPLCANSGHSVVLFDDLVGSGEQRSGYGDTQRLCCFQIYNEFVFAWGLHGQIGGFLAP